MSRYKTFTFRVSADELEMLASLSRYHYRSQSDVIRMLLRQAIKKMPNNSEAKTVKKGGNHYEQPTIKS